MINEIWHGDCLDLMQNIPDKSIDMILCDLPYGTTNCKWDVIIPFDLLWVQYSRIVKDNAAILLFAQTPFDKILGCSNLKMLKYEWIWEKGLATGHLNVKTSPLKAHENILVFYKKPPTYNPQKTHGHERKISSAKNRASCINRRNEAGTGVYNAEIPEKVLTYDSTERFPRSVLKFSTDKQKSTLNETQKPVSLLEYFIKTYSNEGELILDNCAGSGSMAEAAINTNRKYLLIEKRLDQIQKATNRINDILYKDLL